MFGRKIQISAVWLTILFGLFLPIGANAQLPKEFAALGDTCASSEQYAEAIKACGEFIASGRFKPQILAAAHSNRAQALERKLVAGDVSNDTGSDDSQEKTCARIGEDYKQATRLESSNSAWHALMGRHLVGAFGCPPEPELALKELTWALRSHSSPFVKALALSWRAEAYNRLDKHDLGIADLTALINAGVDVPWNLGRRGNYHLVLKQYERAIEDLSQAISAKPSVKEYYIDRGKAYARSKHPDEARADYEQVLKLDPSDPEAKPLIQMIDVFGRNP